jgi:erythromycin 3''-O-methyltransferase
MAARWTTANARHALGMLHYGPNATAAVYDSLGTDFFLALAPGWLNLGLWEGDGADAAEAPLAARRLVERVAGHLPRGGDVLDVGNGLAEQDPVIAATAAPRSLTALNVTLSQLRAGRPRLDEAGAHGVNGDATRMPFSAASFDGVISVEAAFHFSSRERFFAEAFRVLRPGGVLTMSDIPTNRYPRGPREAFAALTQLRAWGLSVHAAASATAIAAAAARAGFTDVRTESVGDRTIGPALRYVHGKLDREGERLPSTYELGVRFMVAQVDLLWSRGVIDYLLLHATKPGS